MIVVHDPTTFLCVSSSSDTNTQKNKKKNKLRYDYIRHLKTKHF